MNLDNRTANPTSIATNQARYLSISYQSNSRYMTLFHLVYKEPLDHRDKSFWKNELQGTKIAEYKSIHTQDFLGRNL